MNHSKSRAGIPIRFKRSPWGLPKGRLRRRRSAPITREECHGAPGLGKQGR